MNFLKQTSYMFYKTTCISIGLVSIYCALSAMFFSISDFPLSIKYLIASVIFYFLHEGLFVKEKKWIFDVLISFIQWFII